MWLFFEKKWAFSGNVVGDTCINQEFMTSNYDLVICSNNKHIVDDVNGWIIEDDVIYGSFGSNKYFGFELDSELLSTFDSLHGMNYFLKSKGMQAYNMNREENVYHLLYGNARNRKY